jgi:hypothetical protein
MKMYIYLMVLGCFLLESCVRDVDFDQLDDIEINTIHNVSLIHFDMDPSNFLDDFENEVLMSSDTIALPILGGNYTINYLNQAELKYKFSNSFDRNGSLEIEFLDAYNGSLFTLQKIYIDANISNFEVTQEFDDFELQRFFDTERIVVNLKLSNGSNPLDQNQTYLFSSQMALLLYYKVKPADD